MDFPSRVIDPEDKAAIYRAAHERRRCVVWESSSVSLKAERSKHPGVGFLGMSTSYQIYHRPSEVMGGSDYIDLVVVAKIGRRFDEKTVNRGHNWEVKDGVFWSTVYVVYKPIPGSPESSYRFSFTDYSNGCNHNHQDVFNLASYASKVTLGDLTFEGDRPVVEFWRNSKGRIKEENHLEVYFKPGHGTSHDSGSYSHYSSFASATAGEAELSHVSQRTIDRVAQIYQGVRVVGRSVGKGRRATSVEIKPRKGVNFGSFYRDRSPNFINNIPVATCLHRLPGECFHRDSTSRVPMIYLERTAPKKVDYHNYASSHRWLEALCRNLRVTLCIKGPYYPETVLDIKDSLTRDGLTSLVAANKGEVFSSLAEDFGIWINKDA